MFTFGCKKNANTCDKIEINGYNRQNFNDKIVIVISITTTSTVTTAATTTTTTRVNESFSLQNKMHTEEK